MVILSDTARLRRYRARARGYTADRLTFGGGEAATQSQPPPRDASKRGLRAARITYCCIDGSLSALRLDQKNYGGGNQMLQDVWPDWETWLEVQLLDLLGKCAAKLEADGTHPDEAGIDVAAAARAVVNRWDPAWRLVDAGPCTGSETAPDPK